MRAILLGMNNPVSPKPEHALYPYPPNCTGWRLMKLLETRVPGITRYDYLNGFERVNLVNSKTWSKEEARRAAKRLPSLYRGRTIVVLGGAVRDALELPAVLIHPVRKDGCVWRQLPHPSGRCRWYNDPECATLAATLLEELYLRGRSNGREI
jgi:hypothetical protein